MNSKSSKKDLVSMTDLSRDEIFELLEETAKIKKEKLSAKTRQLLTGKTLAMILQKPSTRTTVSFAVGMVQLGGHPLVLNPQDLQLKRGETLEDTAKILSLYVDGIMIRANRHEDVETLAKTAPIPVINGLTDKEHPCQVLGDLFTIFERKKMKDVRDLKKMKVCYLGDGNNMAQTWLIAAGILGFDLVIASPKNYLPERFFIQKAQELAKTSGAKIDIVEDPLAAVSGAEVVYTDVWASMGKDEEREQRKGIFQPYQVNAPLLAFAKQGCLIMHCLPAHRDEEITDEVMQSPYSVIFEQAENRLHIQKAILLRHLS